MALVALGQSTGARAEVYDGSPPWVDRAMRIVVSIGVPRLADISDPEEHSTQRTGVAFFVGIRGQTAYLVTAGHVIWPSGIPDRETVKLDTKMDLPECRTIVPAIADSAYASSQDELDMALVEIKLTDVPNDVVNHCRDVITHLPRHILDPLADSLPENAHAWLIAPGVRYAGTDSRPIAGLRYAGDKPRTIARFESYDKNKLQFREAALRPGDSGSPIFSERGYIIGMAIEENNGEATRYSLILTKLEHWKIPTNLAGLSSRLFFTGDWDRNTRLSIEGAPAVRIEVPQLVPLGEALDLKLRIDDTQELTATVSIRKGTDMDCDVALSSLLARYKRPELYTTIGLAAATGLAFAAAKVSQNNFDQLPSKGSYDHVKLFNAITVGAGSTALISLGITVVGYLSNDRSHVTCHEHQP